MEFFKTAYDCRACPISIACMIVFYVQNDNVLIVFFFENVFLKNILQLII